MSPLTYPAFVPMLMELITVGMYMMMGTISVYKNRPVDRLID